MIDFQTVRFDPVIHSTARVVSVLCLTILTSSCRPQATDELPLDTVSLADYQRAEQFLAPNTNPLVTDIITGLYWQDNGELLYRKRIVSGSDYRRLDPQTLENRPLLNLVRLLPLLSAQADEEIAAADLELGALELLDANRIKFSYSGDNYVLQTDDYVLSRLDDADGDEFLSPDKSRAAFIRDYNLWVRDTASQLETQLTFDGTEDYGYATNNAGWIKDDKPVLLWSDDSQHLATFRQDAREVGEMYLYTTDVGHSELRQWKYPLPGDKNIFMLERLAINLGDTPQLVHLQMNADPQRSTVTDHVASGDGTLLDTRWSRDGSLLAFVSSSRDHKVAQLRVADSRTGIVRDVLREEVATYYESGAGDHNWELLADSNEFIWFSEQDDWGHFYLHDLTTGALKNRITSGPWTVLSLEYVDPVNRQIYFTAGGREAGDPYYHYLYRVALSGDNLTLLTPEPGHHQISWSSDHQYFVDRVSTPQIPPVARLRERNGDTLLVLESADISQLEQSGWNPPEPFMVKARDGVTELYGQMYHPSNFDASRRYPILNYIYPGPQTGSIGSRAFQASRGDKQALAELGFIVVEVDAMGTPGRSKSFHDVYYGNMGDNGIPDQIAMIQQLAERHPHMDLDHVGIWGHSGGGFASTAALLRYPDFYKVAVSGAGNHDNRNYEDDWGEKWQGLLTDMPATAETDSAGTATSYDNQANQLLADNLQGKLLIAHGLLDDNVPPTNTFLVVQALIDADKDFDLVVFPEARHGFGNSRYFLKRRWDYFVRYLKAAEPPADFRFADNIP